MPSSDIRLQRVLPVSLAVVQRQVRASDLARIVPESCGLVWKVVRAQGTQAGRHVAIYWDISIRLEVGVEIEGPFHEEGGVVRGATPAGLVATATHLGPYGGLGAAHDAIRHWCDTRQCRAAGPSWEIYGHWQQAWNDDPAQIRTDVYHLVVDDARSV